jgi:thioredoxin 1
MEDLSIRFLIVGIIITSIVVLKAISLRRNREVSGTKKVNQKLLPFWQPGKEAIMFFTSNSCVECEKLQKPAINELKTKSTQIYTIDAAENTKLVDYFRILTVPTTIILDNKGIPQFINQGYANEKKLMEQLSRI